MKVDSATIPPGYERVPDGEILGKNDLFPESFESRYSKLTHDNHSWAETRYAGLPAESTHHTYIRKIDSAFPITPSIKKTFNVEQGRWE